MVLSALQRAKRTFVSVLLATASAFGLVLNVSRESEDKALTAAYRKVAKKAHLDKGGCTRSFQKLQGAREAWDAAREKEVPSGRPESRNSGHGGLVTLPTKTEGAEYRVRGVAVLLTYFGEWSLALWQEFLTFVRGRLQAWSVLRWCATLEKSTAGKLHAHLALQFRSSVDRVVKYFSWLGRNPNASSHDYLGEGLCKNPRFLQQAVDRGFFYVFADKEGTQKDDQGRACVEGNHFPAWVQAKRSTHYAVPGKWPWNLWRQHRLSHKTYELYLHLCRDSVQARKRNLETVRQWEEELEEDLERKATVKRVRQTCFEPFPEVPEVTAWLQLFDKDAMCNAKAQMLGLGLYALWLGSVASLVERAKRKRV